MNTLYRRWDYNQQMQSKNVVHVRVPSLLDAITYLVLGVMALLAIRGLETLQSELMLLGLCVAFGAIYRFVFRTGIYEKNPSLYFESQLIVLILMLMLVTRSIDAINFFALLLALQAALVFNGKTASIWIAVYYLTVSMAVFNQNGINGLYAFIFYFVTYVAMGFFGHILQQAELARDRNQRLIEELQATQQKLRELAVVEERNRLARDLHDSVKQQVFAISMQLGAARTSLSETDKAYQSVTEAERLAQQAGTELTALINALRPPSLGRKSLPDAIREYVEEWSRQNHIKIDMNIDSTISVDEQVEQALFRVLQEALANVARHSKADKVRVELRSEGGTVTLNIDDNGIGFDSKEIAKGIGLDSMQERLIVVNGNVDIVSEKNRGTRVIAKVRRS